MLPFRSIVAITALACFGVPAAAQGQLNVLCSVQAEWCKVIADQFEKDTGIKVALVSTRGRDALATLTEQAGNPRADVWFGGSAGTHLRGAKFRVFDEYASPMIGELQPWAQQVAEQSKSQSVGVYARVLGIGYNSALAAQKKIAAPACWKDLVKPGFAGEVHIADPDTSDATYMAIVAMAEIFGENEAFKYQKAMYKAPPAKTGRDAAQSKSRFLKDVPLPGASKDRSQKVWAGKDAADKAGSGSAGAKAPPPVGSAMAGIGFIGDIVAEAEAGAQVKAVAPCEGTIYDVGALSILKGAKNLDNAKKFVDWALGAKAQALPAQVKQYVYPANTSVTVSPLAPKFGEIKFISYDAAKYGKSGTRRGSLDRWTHEVGTAAP